MSLCRTEINDNSPNPECTDTLPVNELEVATSPRDDAVAAELTRNVSEVDDAGTENRPCTQTTTLNCSRLSLVPTVEEASGPPSTGRPSKLTKFIDRRTETLISACATVSTSAVDDAATTRDDVIDNCENDKPVTSSVLRPTKHRDRKLVGSPPRDCRQLGVGTVHRSMSKTVPDTSTTTASSVDVARTPTSLIVLRSERLPAATSDVVDVTSPCNAESRLTVTLVESTGERLHRNCRLITRPAAATTSTTPQNAACRSGSESLDDDVAVQSRQPRLRSPTAGDVELLRPTSTQCVLNQQSPIIVQPRSAPNWSPTTDRQVLTVSLVASSSAADQTSTTTSVTSRRAVVDSVQSPTSRSAAVTSLCPAVKPHGSSASPSTVPSLPPQGLGPPRTGTLVVNGVSADLDDALAMLTSVAAESCPPRPASTASPHLHDAQPTLAQSTCKSPCTGH